MNNSVKRETLGAEEPVRRQLLIRSGQLLGLGLAANVLSPLVPIANALERRIKVAVQIHEVQRFLDAAGNVARERIRPAEEKGNAYLLQLYQDRGRERFDPLQRVVAYIDRGTGRGRELIKVEKGGGEYISRLGTDTFVFEGPVDTKAPVDLCTTPENPCGTTQWWDGLKVVAYKIEPNWAIDYDDPVFVIDVAEKCGPKDRLIHSDIKPQPATPVPVTSTPIPTPEATPTITIIPAPVQTPSQKPRSKIDPSLDVEFGAVAILPPGQLIRTIYE